MVLLVTAIVLVVLLYPRKTRSNIEEASQIIETPLSSLSETPTPEEVKLAVSYVTQINGFPELYKTCFCESGFDYRAVGKAGEIGILQYMPSTWKYWNSERIKEIGYMTRPLNIYSTKDQLEMLVWAWNKGYQSHWSCFNKYY